MPLLVPSVICMLVVTSVAVVVLLPVLSFVSGAIAVAVLILKVAVATLLKRSPILAMVAVMLTPFFIGSSPVLSMWPHSRIRFSPAVLCIL